MTLSVHVQVGMMKLLPVPILCPESYGFSADIIEAVN